MCLYSFGLVNFTAMLCGRPGRLHYASRSSLGLCVRGGEGATLVTGTFVPTYFRSWERKFHGWNFRSLELSLPGTSAPESENNVELSLPEWKMACNFHSTPCPKIVVAARRAAAYTSAHGVATCLPGLRGILRKQSV